MHDDRKLFEFLVLEGAQAGLSWRTILMKRDNYRKAFDGFEPKKVSRYDEKKVRDLLSDAGIIRNQLKIRSAIQNAKACLEVQEEFGSLDSYTWRFIGGKPKVNRWKNIGEIPPSSREAQIMSKDMIKRGFKFVGPTIIYAHMQAVGMVNDHVVSCFRYKELGG